MLIQRHFNYTIPKDMVFIEGFLNNIDSRYFISKIEEGINQENNENYKTNVKGKFTGFDSLVYEPETLEFMRYIEPSISNIYNRIAYVKECWGNIYNNDDHALLHHHQDCSGFSGILYLTEGGPGTYFSDFDITINEEYGKVVLFDPLLLHQVKSSNLKNSRITMGFNCHEKKAWSEWEDINV